MMPTAPFSGTGAPISYASSQAARIGSATGLPSLKSP